MLPLLLLVACIILVAVTAAMVKMALSAHRRGGGTSADGGDSNALLAQARREASEITARAREQAKRAKELATEELGLREETLNTLFDLVADQEAQTQEQRRKLEDRRRSYRATNAELLDSIEKIKEEKSRIVDVLAQTSGLPREEAANQVLQRLEQELSSEKQSRVARAVELAADDPTAAARRVLNEAIERQSSSHFDGVPRTSAIPLDQTEEEKAGKLQQALEELAKETGAEFAIDQERGAASLRTMDPIARELGRQVSLELAERQLDALAVPALVQSSRSKLANDVHLLGERAMWEIQIEGRSELADLLGTLNYRFSYGQNALLHCKETGFVCQVLAAELGLDSHTARLAGFLHDVGKAVDHSVEGSHAIIGGELLDLLGVSPEITHAVKAHHFDVEPSTQLALLTICADAVSASRPGARRDTMTAYLARLEQLQEIATRHRGVERAFPLQAGREVRISVKPTIVKDADVAPLCGEIAKEIEAEMNYPGMIKVTVIRETTATANVK